MLFLYETVQGSKARKKRSSCFIGTCANMCVRYKSMTTKIKVRIKAQTQIPWGIVAFGLVHEQTIACRNP